MNVGGPEFSSLKLSGLLLHYWHEISENFCQIQKNVFHCFVFMGKSCTLAVLTDFLD